MTQLYFWQIAQNLGKDKCRLLSAKGGVVEEPHG